MQPDHATITFPMLWDVARFMAGPVVILLGTLEWFNRHMPTSPLRNALAWWRRNGVGPLRLAGRAIDFARALGYCLADVIPAAWARGRDRWKEYEFRVQQER